MKTVRRVVPFALILALAFVLPAPAAEEAKEAPGSQATCVAHCEKALAAAKAADYDAVIAACHAAIDEAQKIKQGDMTVLFPGAPGKEWVVGEIKKERMAMGSGGQSFSGIHVSRTYTHVESKAVVKVLVTDWSMMQAQMRAYMSMKEHQGAMLKAIGLTFFEKDGHTCMKVDPPEGGDVQMMAFGEKRMLMAESGKGQIEKVKTVFDLFDLKKVLAK